MSEQPFCKFNPELSASIKEFRTKQSSSGNAAIVFKIVEQEKSIVEVESFVDITLDDLVEELPDNAPRYILLRCRVVHKDERVSYPLILIHWSPETVNARTNMLYTLSSGVVQDETHLGKIVHIKNEESFVKEVQKELH